MRPTPSQRCEDVLHRLMVADARAMRKPNYGGEVPVEHRPRKTINRESVRKREARRAVEAALSDEWQSAQEIAAKAGNVTFRHVGAYMLAIPCERRVVRDGKRLRYVYRRAQA